MTARTVSGVDAGPLPERGARVWVTVDGGDAEWTAIVDGSGGDHLFLTVEAGAGPPPGLDPERRLLVTYSNREVPCEAEAVLATVEAGPERIALRLAGPPRRNQRRSAVRVPVDLIVRARRAGEADDGAVPETFAAVTENLSAGGVLLRADHAVPVGTELLICLQPGGDAPTMELPSRIVRCDRDPAAVRPWRLAVAFTRTTPAQEEHIIRYLFRIQREARRREAGLDR